MYIDLDELAIGTFLACWVVNKDNGLFMKALSTGIIQYTEGTLVGSFVFVNCRSWRNITIRPFVNKIRNRR